MQPQNNCSTKRKHLKKTMNGVIASVMYNSRAKTKCLPKAHDISKPMAEYKHIIRGNGEYR